MKRNMSDTLKQLIAGIIIVCAIFMLAGGIIIARRGGGWLQFILGVLLGGIISVVLVCHMERSIENALMRDQEGAEKYSRKMAAIRYLIMIVALGAAMMLPRVFNIFGVLLGILALKLSAYMHPVTSKYISNK